MSRLLWMAAVGAMVCGWPAFGQESTRRDFEEFCRAWEGRWVGEVTWIADWPSLGKEGDKVTAYWEGRVVADGHAMTATFFGGDGAGPSLIFFDPSVKQIKWISVDSGGTTRLGVIFKEGTAWRQKTDITKADGTKIEYWNTVTISEDGNVHTWTGSGTTGDQKIEGQRDVWRRVSRSAQK